MLGKTVSHYRIVGKHGAVAGTTLGRRLGGGALPESEVVAIAIQIAAAIEEAHEHGVIHRDLKPANVVVSDRGHVKLLDFGLAQLLRRDQPGSAIRSSGVPARPCHRLDDHGRSVAQDFRGRPLGDDLRGVVSNADDGVGTHLLCVLDHLVVGLAARLFAHLGVRSDAPANDVLEPADDTLRDRGGPGR